MGGSDRKQVEMVSQSQTGRQATRHAAQRRNSVLAISIIQLSFTFFGIPWILKEVPSIVVGLPVSTLYSSDGETSRLEQSAYDLMQRATSGNSGSYRDVISTKASDIFPRRNMWELISSSSDVIPLRSKYNNGSSHFSQWGTPAAHNPQLSVETRLQKLEHHFNSLRVYDDDCRQRLLCEIAESPAKFAPLTSAFLDETSFNGDEKSLASKLLETNDGTRLLSYIEATQRGVSRQGCEIWTYRCPLAASSMIDFKALLVWRELSKWLTVKFVAKKHQN